MVGCERVQEGARECWRVREGAEGEGGCGKVQEGVERVQEGAGRYRRVHEGPKSDEC